MTPLADTLDSPGSGRRVAAWVDADGYGRQRLLSGTPIPWRDPGTAGDFAARLNGITDSDAVLLDLAGLVDGEIGSDAQLASTLAGQRPGARPLRAALDAAATVGAARTAVAVTAAAVPARPLVIRLPSPSSWVGRLAGRAAAAAGARPEPGAGVRAAIYIAGFLRALADLPVRGLLVSGEAAADELAPVMNTAAAYRWGVVLLGPGPAAPGTLVHVDGPAAAGRTGRRAPAGFWAGQPAPQLAAGDLLLLEVPAQSDPDTVRARCAEAGR
jgi:hypothetical protein